MYLDNKYTKTYFLLIKKATDRNLNDRKIAQNTLGYVERHHILPRSLGGSNKKENLVFLTPKEHFVCHRLLVRMTYGKNRVKMIYAFHKMMSNNYNQKRIIFTARMFEYARYLIMSTNGEDHYNFGKKRSDLWKTTRSALYTGENNPNYGNKGSRNPLTGKPSKKKKGNAGKYNPMYGRDHKSSSKKLMSDQAFLRPKVSCICCKKIVDVSNFNRWHGDKCKMKIK